MARSKKNRQEREVRREVEEAIAEVVEAPAVAHETPPEPAPPAPEPTPVIEAPPEPERVVQGTVEQVEPTMLDAETVSTPESAPFPSKNEEPTTVRPKLRLLRFDGPELEKTLAGALETVERFTQTPGAAGDEVRRLVTDLSGKLGGAQARATAAELLSQVGQLLASANTAPAPEVDDFGRDAAFEAKLLALFEPIYRYWFRVQTSGLENIPNEGPVILVANHSGAVPFDMAMLKTALALEHPEKRALRPLAENFTFHFPFVGTWLNRFGAVRACQENAEALLGKGEAIAVFPEGVKGLGKTFGRRYKLQRFGRGGVVKLAMRTGAPIVPVAIVGAEETYPLLARIVRPVAPLGLPYLPVTPTFPLLGPAGLLPLPTKWTIEIGAPIRYDSGEVDELTIEKRTEDLRAGLQERLDRLVGGRRGIFF